MKLSLVSAVPAAFVAAVQTLIAASTQSVRLGVVSHDHGVLSACVTEHGDTPHLPGSLLEVAVFPGADAAEQFAAVQSLDPTWQPLALFANPPEPTEKPSRKVAPAALLLLAARYQV